MSYQYFLVEDIAAPSLSENVLLEEIDAKVA